MDVPPFCHELDAKPGKLWTDEETQRLKQCLFERSQLKLIWTCAARYLGTGATAQDVEDAVVDFFILFEQARQSYKPGGPDFCCYLLHVCFKNHCVREGDRIRRRRARECSLDRETPEGDVLELELEASQGSDDPERHTQDSAFLTDLKEFLASPQLNINQRQAFALRYLDDMSYEEIAQTMGVPIGSVKGWLNRATRIARAYLEARGWFVCGTAK